MCNTPGFHYEFYLGKYSDVYSMPDDTAREFLRQFRVYLWQKEALVNKYRQLGWQHNNIGISQLDEEDGCSDFNGCNDCSNGDEFIRSIIDQRRDIISHYERSLRIASEEEERFAKRKKDVIRENYEWAMARAEEREEERKEQEFQKRNRIDAANAVVQVELYKRKQAAKQKARQEAVFKEWEENKKQFAKKK